MASLSLRNIKKAYGNNAPVIEGLNLEVGKGEFVVFVGPSGCGKSTLLRMIAGLEDITGGDLLIEGERANELHPSERGIAMVFQSYALYPHMTVGENMGFALRLSGMDKRAIKEAVGRAAEVLRITHLLDRKPAALSGGQRQRVAIGRAIVRQPKVFLFDEPLSNLDASLRVQMRIELARLHRELGTTMVYVTHDQVEAMTLGDRIAVFNAGKLEQVGPPIQLYREPRSTFVAGFLGSPKMNFLDVETAGAVAGNLQLKLGGNQSLDFGRTPVGTLPSQLTLGIRPEHVRVVPAAAGLQARVDMVENLGDTQLVHTALAGSEASFSIRMAPDAISPRVGDVVGIHIDSANALLFDRTGRALELA
ncbi:ABC transporter ATP-binding protein [Amantichitinum ursilacus]|uniref:Maltose/maltodextrin import ATP-binding protein MalK n=1 Tax=Amantichitinum ursilacus TaxID=857265 RepID=A0A0N0GQX4_9NEIS|nr:sn-glycerol-3-phosphate ABC transporter ATP-binding protein UgpC [Amantichitinum ursilacus]KPC54851.1 Maltose/maltodextrin import ATP-binding protein MalK [Amantichitinum ursilacus]